MRPNPSDGSVPLSACVTQSRMIGWIEYLGERYPFVARRIVE